MKKSILAITILGFIASMSLTSCSSPAEKVEKAADNVTKANEDLDKAHEDYIENIENYRKEAQEKFDANQQSIAEFSVRISNEKKEAKEDYKRKLAELELKNTDLKKRMDEYRASGKEGWEKFKSDFNNDMEILAKAFMDLKSNNVK